MRLFQNNSLTETLKIFEIKKISLTFKMWRGFFVVFVFLDKFWIDFFSGCLAGSDDCKLRKPWTSWTKLLLRCWEWRRKNCLLFAFLELGHFNTLGYTEIDCSVQTTMTATKSTEWGIKGLFLTNLWNDHTAPLPRALFAFDCLQNKPWLYLFNIKRVFAQIDDAYLCTTLARSPHASIFLLCDDN